MVQPVNVYVIFDTSHLIITILICLLTASLLTTVDFVYNCVHRDFHIILRLAQDHDSLIKLQLKITMYAHSMHSGQNR